jgi:hypothetical protein
MPNNAFEHTDYAYQKEVYDRQKKIYEDQMREWETFNKTSLDMDARFDKTLFTIAAGSFGLSFAFIDTIVKIASAIHTGILLASWSCFAGCLIVMVIGHLLSAETYRRYRDNVAKDMTLQFSGKPIENKNIIDVVSPCNYIALILYIGGII